MKYCWKCGAQLNDEAEFCVKCGTKQKTEPEPGLENGQESEKLGGRKKSKPIALFVVLAVLAAAVVVGIIVFNRSVGQETTEKALVTDPSGNAETMTQPQTTAAEIIAAEKTAAEKAAVEETTANGITAEETTAETAGKEKTQDLADAYQGEWFCAYVSVVIEPVKDHYNVTYKKRANSCDGFTSSMTCTESDGKLVYRDEVYSEYSTDDSGNESKTEKYTNGEGYFEIVSDYRVQAPNGYHCMVMSRNGSPKYDEAPYLIWTWKERETDPTDPQNWVGCYYTKYGTDPEIIIKEAAADHVIMTYTWESEEGVHTSTETHTFTDGLKNKIHNYFYAYDGTVSGYGEFTLSGDRLYLEGYDKDGFGDGYYGHEVYYRGADNFDYEAATLDDCSGTYLTADGLLVEIWENPNTNYEYLMNIEFPDGKRANNVRVAPLAGEMEISLKTSDGIGFKGYFSPEGDHYLFYISESNWTPLPAGYISDYLYKEY